MRESRVLVIGAGVVGAACAYYAARAGLRVTVVDRGPIAGGTSGAGEGNLLVSDKEPGPELDLALLSLRLWAQLAAELGDTFEYEAKGGLVVAGTEDGLRALRRMAAAQRDCGVQATAVDARRLRDYEPYLSADLAGGTHYPQDAQVQPMLAAARLLQAARRHGARLRTGTTVTGMLTQGGRVTGVRTDRGDIGADAVVNAAGPWAGEICRLPVVPRRGFVLVTEPLGLVVRHKVYSADYVANVTSDSAALQTSAVVEGTRAGTVLVGASRERVGFDRRLRPQVLRRLAAQAVALFPALREAAAIRAYCGFRPYSPDHLPIIGPDPRLDGLVHACGHEGAGIGLAAATGWLVCQHLAGERTDLGLDPFLPARFESGVAS